MMPKLNKTQWISVGWWGFLLAGALGYFWFIPEPWRVAWLLTVAASEVVSLKLTNMLPLSPIVQWIDDRGTDRARWWQGPRALALVPVVEIFVFGIWALIPYAPWWVSGPILSCFCLWLIYHWTRPEVYER